MCNLYNIATNHEAMHRLFPKFGDVTNRVDPKLDVYPDYPAPVLRNIGYSEHELALLRWGMPTPPIYVKGNADTGVTNVLNLTSPHWRRWQGVESRCIVPATSISEYGHELDPKTKRKPLHWFAVNERKPLFAFAGIWTRQKIMREKKEPARPPIMLTSRMKNNIVKVDRANSTSKSHIDHASRINLNTG